MKTTIFLVRNAATDWNRDKRVVGRREIGLSEAGIAQAEALSERCAKLDIGEVLSSPLVRAMETAERIARPHQLEIARDPRLTDFHAGRWEGMKHAEVSASDDYKRFLANPLAQAIPAGERLTDARDRLVSSVAQALADNELGASILIISHAGPLRLLLAHYLGMDLANFHRLRLSTASVTALRFESLEGVPRVLTVNCVDALASALS
jgi:phosphoserine phosphatase